MTCAVVHVMLGFSFLRKYYGGWWFGCAGFEVSFECGAAVDSGLALTVSYAPLVRILQTIFI
jgi:hypothetical protein